MLILLPCKHWYPPPELLCLIELVEIGLKCCYERKQRRLIETINKKDIKEILMKRIF